MVADTDAQVEKALQRAKEAQERIDKIKKKVDKFQGDMLDIINKAQNAVNNAGGRTQKSINKELEKLQGKYDEKHAAAQKWVDDQLEQVGKWIDEQIKTIQREAKEVMAWAEIQILECSMGIKLPKEMKDSVIDSMPDIPIPRPSIPSIQIPKPAFPYPDIEGMYNSLVDASGFNQIAETGKNIANIDKSKFI